MTREEVGGKKVNKKKVKTNQRSRRKKVGKKLKKE